MIQVTSMIGPTLLAGILIIMIFILVRMGFFDTVGDFAGRLYNAASDAGQKVGNVAKALVSTAKSWMEGQYHAPDFTGGGTYAWCGPGTRINQAGQPINVVDAACRTHDLDYDRFGKMRGTVPASDLNRLIRQSDENLIRAIDASGQTDWGARIARHAIRAKTKAEDWGLLNPTKFLG